MRDEFYADRRDLWKWTIAFDLAGADAKILYVAMLRPRTSRSVPPALDKKDDRRVLDFFLREWDELDGDPLCARIGNLNPRIEPVLEFYRPPERKAYFEHVVQQKLKARPTDNRYVVLIDPDTGLATEKPTPKHLYWDDMVTVWNAMRASDILLLYQHTLREKKTAWVEGLRTKLAGHLGLATDKIGCQSCSDVCFFSATKIL